MSPFAPTLQAQQLPHLRLVRLMYWVARARQPQIAAGCARRHGVVVWLAHENQALLLQHRCVTAVWQRRCRSCSGGRAKLPTVRGDAVVFERAVPWCVVPAGRCRQRASLHAVGGRCACRTAAGTAAVQSATRTTSRARRSRGWRGARGAAGFATGTLTTAG
jgi:hypothetical protein